MAGKTCCAVLCSTLTSILVVLHDPSLPLLTSQWRGTLYREERRRGEAKRGKERRGKERIGEERQREERSGVERSGVERSRGRER